LGRKKEEAYNYMSILLSELHEAEGKKAVRKVEFRGRIVFPETNGRKILLSENPKGKGEQRQKNTGIHLGDGTTIRSL